MIRLETLSSTAAALCVVCLTEAAHGEGLFSELPIWSSGTSASGGDGIARLFDFDLDGNLDFVTSAPSPKRWVLYRNENGELSKKPFWESNETTDCDHIDVVDFNRDGWMDLAATHESHCTLYLNRWGSFAEKPNWETDITADANQIDFGDFDGDGDYDMVMAAGEPIQGVVLFETKNPTEKVPNEKGQQPENMPSRKPTLRLGRSEYSEAAIFADFDNDGDGKLDVIAHYRSGETVVYRNIDNQFDEGTVLYLDPENAWTQRHYFHDLDRDGRPELFAAKGAWGDNGTSLQLTRQDSGRAMQVRWKSSPDTMFHAFSFDDVDGDGDTDLIASDYAGGGYARVYLNENGRLSALPAQSVKTTGPVHEAALGDIDLDGDLDLAVGARDQAHIYENLTVTTGFFSAAKRARPLLDAELAFRPSVFLAYGKGEKGKSSGGFPPCDFLNSDRARRWLGDYEIDVTFYSKDYAEVEKPAAPGRYGAVVKITAEDGREYTRFRTLYNSWNAKRAWSDSIDVGVRGELQFSSATEVAERTWHDQRQLVNDYIGRAIQRDTLRSDEFAVILAAMDEMSPEQGPASQLENAVAKDRRWWLKLKRKLNGNAERFREAIVAPVPVDGREASVLREGTEEDAGMRSGTAAKIHAVLEEWANNSDQPFNAVVARKGVVFFNRAYGSRDGEPVTTKTRHVVFSITKALSGALLMTFVDRGVIRLDDPVGKVLPEFRDSGVENPVTFHHLFTHTADMDGHFTDQRNDLEHAYGEAYPYLGIGKQHRYNGTSIAIGLKALEQLTGLTLPDLYQKYLFGPLECESIESVDGSAMTWSNAYDLARFGQMLANRGAYGNLRFFREETFHEMLPRKLDKLLGPETNVTWGVGLTWFRGNGLSDKTIGHGSASSCTLRVDLEKDLVITMTRQTAGKNFGRYHSKFIATVTSGVAVADG